MNPLLLHRRARSERLWPGARVRRTRETRTSSGPRALARATAFQEGRGHGGLHRAAPAAVCCPDGDPRGPVGPPRAGAMWRCGLQTSGAAPLSGAGPLRWVPSLDGYRLAGSHVPARTERNGAVTRAGGRKPDSGLAPPADPPGYVLNHRIGTSCSANPGLRVLPTPPVCQRPVLTIGEEHPGHTTDSLLIASLHAAADRACLAKALGEFGRLRAHYLHLPPPRRRRDVSGGGMPPAQQGRGPARAAPPTVPGQRPLRGRRAATRCCTPTSTCRVKSRSSAMTTRGLGA